MKNLEDIRKEINEVDDQLLDIIIHRLNLSKEVGEYKLANNLPIVDRDRELWILDKMTEGKSEDLVIPLRETYESLFRVSRRRQARLIDPDNTFIDGVRATFTDEPFPRQGVVAISGDIHDLPIVSALFEHPHVLNFSNDMKIVDAVNAGLCQYGLLPIEDNRSGANAHSYDLLMDRTCHIVRGIILNLHYKLVAPDNVPFDRLKTIVLDHRAYEHCSVFLSAFSGEIEEKTSQDILQECAHPTDDFRAWIVPSHMPVPEGMRVMRSEIANPGDYIRYICLAKTPRIYPDADTISLEFSVPDVSGGLDDVLSPLAALGINLSLLESRPMENHDSNRYRFFADLEGDIHDKQLQMLLNDLSRDCQSFSFLGAYKHVELDL
jgi:chorismate mutase/prephenate dehydratase